MVVAASLRTGLDAVNQLERVKPDVARARHRDARTRRHFGAAATARQEARPDHHHGVDADAPQRRDQLQGAVARRRRLHPEAGNHPRVVGRRHLQARSAAEDPPSRRQGTSQAPTGPTPPPAIGVARTGCASGPRAAATSVASQAALVKRSFGPTAPRVLLIGSSTGGPQALMTLVADIGPVIDRFPVLITQHMPPTFTTILAEHLTRAARRPAHEGIDGEIDQARPDLSGSRRPPHAGRQAGRPTQ